jgi:cytochrome c
LPARVKDALLLGLCLMLASVPCRAFAQVRGPSMENQGELPWNRVVEGDPELGRRIIDEIGCGVCHVIPGIRGARGMVGPSLELFAERNVIAGIVPNTPHWLTLWIEDPPAIAPRTMMPDMGLSSAEARHVAAYLLELHD